MLERIQELEEIKRGLITELVEVEAERDALRTDLATAQARIDTLESATTETLQLANKWMRKHDSLGAELAVAQAENARLQSELIQKNLELVRSRMNQNDPSQATHDIETSTLTPEGTARPKIS